MKGGTATAISMSAGASTRHPIAILGVPFDNMTTTEALGRIEEMLAAREPHYVVTANVDFLVQARKDVELRRILFDAHLVLCDGTPLVWASRLLGNPLPERVAGSDLVPRLIESAARKSYRLFFLGSTPDAGAKALANLRACYPDLQIGHYSPPFNKLLEMDHEEITRRVNAFQPDVLLVSFGCPKQEKWIAMHYRSLGVPVSIGVGATIDFLAGQVRRAPLWMQQCGLEWIFRLAQEPRRLAGRYAQDLWFFGAGLASQWWSFRAVDPAGGLGARVMDEAGNGVSEQIVTIRLPGRLDLPALATGVFSVKQIVALRQDCVLDLSGVEFIDSSGIGALIALHKQLRKTGHRLFLLRPTEPARRALALMRLGDFFQSCETEQELAALLRADGDAEESMEVSAPVDTLFWTGEVTAATVAQFREQAMLFLGSVSRESVWIDMSEVRFIDSSGLGLMLRLKKEANQLGMRLGFTGFQQAVRNVLQLAHLQKFFELEPLPASAPDKSLAPALY